MFRLFSVFHCCQLYCIIYLRKYSPQEGILEIVLKERDIFTLQIFFSHPQIALYVGQPEKEEILFLSGN